MKNLILSILIALPLPAFPDSLPDIESIEQLLWENRIILIWSDEPMDVRHTLKESTVDIDDRNIVWFVIDGQEVVSNYRGITASNFVANVNNQYLELNKEVILIGKDGGVKSVDVELKLDMLFEEIDSMPMRINEMESSAGK